VTVLEVSSLTKVNWIPNLQRQYWTIFW